MKFSERAEILLFTREDVALKLNRLLLLSNISLSKIPLARDIPLTGNWPLRTYLQCGRGKEGYVKEGVSERILRF